jgi:hypothetical protein
MRIRWRRNRAPSVLVSRSSFVRKGVSDPAKKYQLALSRRPLRLSMALVVRLAFGEGLVATANPAGYLLFVVHAADARPTVSSAVRLISFKPVR